MAQPRLDAAQVHAVCASLMQAVVDDGVGLCAALDLPRTYFIFWERALDKEVEVGLRPGGRRMVGEIIVWKQL